MEIENSFRRLIIILRSQPNLKLIKLLICGILKNY